MSTWGRGKITHYGLAAANKSEVNHKWNALCTLQMRDRLEDMAAMFLVCNWYSLICLSKAVINIKELA